MTERRVFEHFVVAGLGPEPHEELRPGAAECGYRQTAPLAPVTDICVIFPTMGETPPEGFTMIETTPSGYPADLNHGSLRTAPSYLCLRRGFHKPPLVDIGVLHEGRGERVMVDSQILQTTPFGRPANVNNSSQGIYLTYRRALDNAPPSNLAVTDICVILQNKGETPPHTFCKVPKNLNKGMVGSDVFLCYKKSHASTKRIAYKPSIIAQFPPQDHPLHPPLPPNVDIFCLPMGAVIERWPEKCQMPTRSYSTFILTNEQGRKFYGVAVTFYERYDGELSGEQLSRLGLDPEANAPLPGSCSDNSSTNDPAEHFTFLTNKAICLVSAFPFFTAFKRFLFHLHRMTQSEASHPIPIERLISYLLYEVPFPSPRRPRVLMNLGAETIAFDNPDDTPLPLSGASFFDFLKNLGPENGMYVLLLALMEKPILVHSLRPFLLTSVAEAMTSIIFPFHWQCPYIPQCPLDLAGVLHAPMSFICGVDSRYFELYDDPPKDVTCIDLDTNTISASEVRRSLKLSVLPKRPMRVLRSTLEHLYTKVHQQEWNVTTMRSSNDFIPIDVDFKLQKRRKMIELEIQGAFLRFMASLMQGYKECLVPLQGAPRVGATDIRALFKLDAFMASRGPIGGGSDFWRPFCATQGFARFVEERSLFSDQNAFLAFFDDCIEKIAHPHAHSSPHLLEFESALNSNHTNAFLAFFDDCIEKIAHPHAHSSPHLLEFESALNSNHTNAFLAFFDDCIEKIAHPHAHSSPHLLEFESALNSNHTNAFLAFFDDCIEKIAHPHAHSSPHLLEFESALNSNHTSQADSKGAETEKEANEEQIEPLLIATLPSVRHRRHHPDQEQVFLDPTSGKESEECYKYDGFPRELDPDLFQIQVAMKRREGFSLASASAKSPLPATFRHKQELKYAQRLLRQEATTPLRWAKCLLSYAYSLWFVHLPGMMEAEKEKGQSPLGTLRTAFVVLDRVHKSSLPVFDEVPYRMLMHLSCLYQKPLMTVQVMKAMKAARHAPNAITYGFYNRAVLEAGWGSRFETETAARKWAALRGAVSFIAVIRRAAADVRAAKSATLSSVSTISGAPTDAGYASSLPEECGEALSVTPPGPAAPLAMAQDDDLSLETESLDAVDATCARPLLSPSIGHGRVSITPTRVLPTAVAVDPLGALDTSQDEEKEQTDGHMPADSVLNSSLASSTSTGLFRLEEQEPFQSEEFRDIRHDESDSGGFNYRNLSNWVSKRWTTGRLVRSQTETECLTPENIQSTQASNSPYLSGLVSSATSSRIWKSVGESVAKHGPALGRVAKSYVSPVVKNLREVSLEGLSTPIRNSYSAIQLEGGNLPGSGPLADKYYEIHFGGGGTDATDGEDAAFAKGVSGMRWHQPLEPDEDLEAALPTEDPAFRLSRPGQPLPDPPLPEPPIPSASRSDTKCRLLEVVLCSATRCPKCNQVLYDEELMAGWSPDENNLNSRCRLCLSFILPLLSVRLERREVNPSSEVEMEGLRSSHFWPAERKEKTRLLAKVGTAESTESVCSLPASPAPRGPRASLPTHGLHGRSAFGSTHSLGPQEKPKIARRLNFSSVEDVREEKVDKDDGSVHLGRIRRPRPDNEERVKYLNVPFLSPLVLRREMETAVTTESETVLAHPEFSQRHPILFWNLLYYFQRLGLPTHLTSVLRLADFWPGVEPPPGDDSAPLEVPAFVRCALDSPHLHGAAYPAPLYLALSAEPGPNVPASGLIAALLLDKRRGSAGGPTPAPLAPTLEAMASGKLEKAIRSLLEEHRKRTPVLVPNPLQQSSPSRGLRAHFSLYRELQLLGQSSLEEGSLWTERLEGRYADALAALPPGMRALLPATDLAPPLPALAARRLWRPLDPF